MGHIRNGTHWEGDMLEWDTGNGMVKMSYWELVLRMGYWEWDTGNGILKMSYWGLVLRMECWEWDTGNGILEMGYWEWDVSGTD